MRRREFLIQLGALSLMGMQIGMAGCVGAINGSVGQVTTSTGDAANANGGNSNDQSLAGTCPKGKSCTTPNCPLWSDIDNTGICDRRR
jgi:hypothetical protein